MYFFREIMLSMLCIVGSYFAYSFFSQKEKVSYRLFLWMGFTLLLLFFNEVEFFFLDLFVLLSTFKGKKEDTIFFSFVILAFSLLIPKFFLWTFLLFSCYALTSIFQKRKKKASWFLFEKSFFVSIIYFSSYPITFSSCFWLVLLTYLYAFLFLRLLPLLSVELDHSLSLLENQLFKIVHEIKNPISVCKGYLDMLDIHEEEKVSRYIPIIKNEISRTLTIMDDFMNLRSMSVEKDIMDLYLLIEDTSSTMHSFLEEKKVELIVPKFKRELFILGDYDRLKQVFVNMIKNAYEAHADKIKFETHRRGNLVLIDFIDNGDGISKEDLDKIGNLFYTTKKTGSGVGVSLSKEIIRLHQGELKYQSTVGKGTRVRITLPVEG